MFEEHRLPPAARLVHIGLPKTGTTAIQSAFVRVRDELPQHGVHFAGYRSGLGPRKMAKALRDAAVSAPDRPPTAAWESLVREVHDAAPLRVCISNERFAAVDDAAATRLVNDFGTETVHVAMVVRPLGALLPSHWQQRVRKHRQMVSYDKWLRLILSDQPTNYHHQHFWRWYDVAAQISRWADAGSPERVIVVVSEEGNHRFLPRLFEGMLGLPEGILVPSASRTNRSLDLSEAELLRAVDGLAKDQGWSRDLYLEDLKPAISAYLRSQARDAVVPIPMPEWALERVGELNAAQARALADTNVQVIGDPASLMTKTKTETGVAHPSVDVRIPTDVAAGVAAVSIARMIQRQDRLERRIRRLRAATPGTSTGPRQGMSRTSGRLRAGITGGSSRSRGLRRLVNRSLVGLRGLTRRSGIRG